MEHEKQKKGVGTFPQWLAGHRLTLNSLEAKHLAPLIDHTILKPDADQLQVEKILEEAKEFGFKSVCINPCWVPLASSFLQGTPVEVCTVIGFPLGANHHQLKLDETAMAMEQGATEIDMVLNIGFLKSGLWTEAEKEIKAIAALMASQGVLKVILETCLLTKEEIKMACKVSMQAGANFVKTSTGFSKGGATVEDVELMRSVVGEHLGVKASGGVRDYPTAMAMLNAGATRLGSSSGINIIGKSNS